MAVPATGAALVIASVDTWLPVLQSRAEATPAWLFLATAVLTGLSLLPSHVASLICGFVAGAWAGTAIAIAGSAAAACLGYALARLLIGDRVARLVAARPRAAAVFAALVAQRARERLVLVALLRLSPVMPFAATNLLMAAARVPFGTFQWGSTLGLLPRVTALAWAGAGLARLATAGTLGPWWLAAGVVATGLALWLIGRIVGAALRSARR